MAHVSRIVHMLQLLPAIILIPQPTPTLSAVNWGSSKQALKYNTALGLIHEVSGGSYHVKNFRPQFLVLTGAPSSRPTLVNFVTDVSNMGITCCWKRST